MNQCSAVQSIKSAKFMGRYLKYFSEDDSEKIMAVLLRVGRNTFVYSDISDIITETMLMRRMRTSGIIEMQEKTHHGRSSLWRVKPEIACGIEALVSDMNVGN